MKELEVFGQRLINARIMKGLSMDELCLLMNNRRTYGSIAQEYSIWDV